jgi:hypothetical protein
MSNHLSKEQFAKCIVGQPSRAALQHIGECPGCSAEVERFGSAISQFRSAVRHRIDDRPASHPTEVTPLKHAGAGTPALRWALMATAIVVAAVLPFFISENQPREAPEQAAQAATEATADAIMNRVNFHLSRTLPAPMEPMMSLIPSDALTSKPGGVQ